MVSTIPVPTHSVMGNWGNAYTTEQVSRLAPPPQTNTHRPYDHHTLFDMVSNGLQRSGFEHSEPPTPSAGVWSLLFKHSLTSEPERKDNETQHPPPTGGRGVVAWGIRH